MIDWLILGLLLLNVLATVSVTLQRRQYVAESIRRIKDLALATGRCIELLEQLIQMHKEADRWGFGSGKAESLLEEIRTVVSLINERDRQLMEVLRDGR